MQAFFTSSLEKPNQTEVCGILKFMVTLKEGCSAQHRVAMDALRYCARHDVHKTFPLEWAIANDYSDRFLATAWKRARTDDKLGGDIFCELHCKVLGMVIPQASLQKCVGCKGDWVAIKDDLHKVVASSLVGTELFGFAMGRILASQVMLAICPMTQTVRWVCPVIL